jgi:hypothetical protein
MVNFKLLLNTIVEAVPGQVLIKSKHDKTALLAHPTVSSYTNETGFKFFFIFFAYKYFKESSEEGKVVCSIHTEGKKLYGSLN